MRIDPNRSQPSFMDPAEIGRSLRQKRFTLFLPLVDLVLTVHNRCRILDIGGEPVYWANVAHQLGERPVDITILNLRPLTACDPRVSCVVGDARDLSQYADL